MVLAALSLADAHYTILGEYQTLTFLLTASIYLAFTVITLVYSALAHTPPKDKTLFFSVVSDILFCFMLMHLGGGFGTGLSILLLSPVAIAGIFFYGSVALSLAAIASILILLDVLYITSINTDHFKYIVPAGLMGILFFITSFITQSIAKHIRTTEALVDKSINTVTDLNVLNQFIVQRMITGIVVINHDKKIQLINTIADQLLHTPLNINQKISGKLEQLYDDWLLTGVNSHTAFQDKAGLPMVKISFSMLETVSNLTIAFIENQSALTQQAQHLKLASLGRLSASIAHEIRNPLSSINQSTQLLRESESIVTADKRLLEIIENNIVRLNGIVSNVLDISRKTPASPAHIYILPLILQIIEQLEINKSITIHSIINVDNNMDVLFDESQLHQVLINLIDNAITFSNMNIGMYWVKIDGWVKNDIPNIAISDKGKGVPNDNIDKIFEPFFTTNPKGTGLGLYICRDLCEMNQATLDYMKEELEPHNFCIRFSHRQKRLSPLTEMT